MGCQGEPRTANQTAPSYGEIVGYYSSDWTTVWNGNDPSRNLDNVFDGSSATYTEMHTSHADISYLYLTHGQLTDVVKVVVGYDGDGWLGFKCPEEDHRLVMDLRDVLDSILRHKVENCHGANEHEHALNRIGSYDGHKAANRGVKHHHE